MPYYLLCFFIPRLDVQHNLMLVNTFFLTKVYSKAFYLI